jgi:hypothetical protein
VRYMTETQPEEETMGQVHYHYGHNTAGYLPESDVGMAEDFDSAKRVVIEDMLYRADTEEDEAAAENLTHAAEDVNLSTGPELLEYVDVDPSSEHSLPVAYWVQVCAEDDCSDEEDAY